MMVKMSDDRQLSQPRESEPGAEGSEPIVAPPADLPAMETGAEAAVEAKVEHGQIVAGGRLPSGRHNLPRDVVVNSQRNRVLQAMAEISAERGYGATTVAEIVGRAGVSRATFYELFRDKDDCLLAAANAILGDLITAATTAYSADKPLFHVVRDAVLAILEMMASQPAFARLTFIEGRTNPLTRDLYMSGVRVLISLLDQIRIDSPPEAAVPSSAARAAVGGAETLIRREIAAGRTEQLPQILPAVIYGTLVPFLGREQSLLQAEEARSLVPTPSEA
jgi:AcrR family transcriptional regulator